MFILCHLLEGNCHNYEEFTLIMNSLQFLVQGHSPTLKVKVKVVFVQLSFFFLLFGLTSLSLYHISGNVLILLFFSEMRLEVVVLKTRQLHPGQIKRAPKPIFIYD